MSERQLADLLISIGLDRNVSVEDIASELTALRLPGYIDNTAFQNSLLDAMEAQLHKQTEDRIRVLRQRFAPGAGVAGQLREDHLPMPAPQESASEAVDYLRPTPPAQEDVTVEERDATMVESEEIPNDATMIWKAGDKERKESF